MLRQTTKIYVNPSSLGELKRGTIQSKRLYLPDIAEEVVREQEGLENVILRKLQSRWKEALVILIRKPGKDASSLSGYRSYSLLPVM